MMESYLLEEGLIRVKLLTTIVDKKSREDTGLEIKMKVKNQISIEEKGKKSNGVKIINMTTKLLIENLVEIPYLIMFFVLPLPLLSFAFLMNGF